MQLSELNLNRYLYRQYADDGPDTLSSGNTYIDNSTVAGGTVQPGSPPINGVLLQSSPGDDRVEINPDDHFYAYNGGDIVVTIGKDGIFADQSTIINEDVETLTVSTTLNVDGDFFYHGQLQPIVFTGEILGNGTPVFLPTGWSVVRNAIGDYTFTHNLAAVFPYTVFCSPVSGHFRHQVVSRNANDFNINYEQTLYGADTFPVSGGAGGTVTVQGVRLAPGEEPFDVGFQFEMLFFG